jgi:hypothetical protein
MGEIFRDSAVASGLTDRLVRYCHIVNIRETATACGSTQTSNAFLILLTRPPQAAPPPRRGLKDAQRRGASSLPPVPCSVRSTSPLPRHDWRMARGCGSV